MRMFVNSTSVFHMLVACCELQLSCYFYSLYPFSMQLMQFNYIILTWPIYVAEIMVKGKSYFILDNIK